MNLTSQHRGAASTQPTAPISTDLADELQRYDAHLRDVRGLASETRRLSVSIVQRLLQQKFSGRPLDIGQLRPADIRRFLAHQLDLRQSSSRARQLAGALRSYLRYRSICGDRVGDLKAAITNPVHWKMASLPRALTPDEIDRLLKSFVTVRRWPKRGYAIVRCALDMGLRAGEIAGLKIADARARSLCGERSRNARTSCRCLWKPDRRWPTTCSTNGGVLAIPPSSFVVTAIPINR